jgi:hypothetical protein
MRASYTYVSIRSWLLWTMRQTQLTNMCICVYEMTKCTVIYVHVHL